MSMAINDNKKFYWLKLDKDFFNSYKIKSLLSEKKGDTYTTILLQLKCECLNYEGVLRYSTNKAYTIEQLANVIGRTPKLLKETLDKLKELELIEIEEDNTIIISDVNVGSATGQTIRKGGKSGVKNTNELPQNEVKTEVRNTQEIRDKRLEIRLDDDDINNINARARYLGADCNVINKAIDVYKHYQISSKDFYQKIMNTMLDSEIYDKEAYISEIARNFIGV